MPVYFSNLKTNSDEADINLDEIKRKLFTAPKSSPTTEVTPAAPEPKPEVETPVVAEQATPEIPSNTNDMHVQVVGKIDLDAINQRTRPDKKKAAAPEEKKTPEPKKVEQEPVTPIEVKIPELVAPVEIETIRFERKVLTGPTVLGRIELPVEKPKISAAESEANKRKRKRIKKEAPAAPAPSANRPANTTSSASPAAKGGKVEKKEISEQDIQKEIKDTLARLSNKGGKSKSSKNRKIKRDSFAQKRQEEMALAEADEKIEAFAL